MFKKVKLENFGPIKEEVIFSMERKRTEQFPENIIEGTNLLKSMYIFGPNNSGKSQLIKAFRLLGHITQGRIAFEQPYFPYLWNDFNDSISKLTYYFCFDETEYIYELELDFLKNCIIKENLKVGERYVFKRKDLEVFFDQKTFPIEKDIFYLTSQYNKEGGIQEIKNMYDYFNDIIFIDQQRDTINTNSFFTKEDMLDYVEENIDRINQLLSDFGFDTKVDIKTSSENIKEKKELYVNKGGSELFAPMELTESFGTLYFFRLLVLIEALKDRNSLIVIDEIERGLHCYLISSFINYILKNYPRKQLILPMHLTDVLESDVKIRKDQVYIAEIKDCLFSISRKFNKKSIRETMNFQKIYKSNGVGGFPNIKINRTEDETCI